MITFSLKKAYTLYNKTNFENLQQLDKNNRPKPLSYLLSVTNCLIDFLKIYS